MKQTAEIFFSDNAVDFDSHYESNPEFRERFEVWTTLLDKYTDNTQEVLDLGCGSGVFSFYLAGKGVSVTGIDGAKNMIELCQKQKAKSGLQNINFIQSQIPVDPSLKKKKYDVIFSSSVLEYIPDFDQALKDAKNMLIPGGIFIVSMPNMNSWYRKLESLSFKLVKYPRYLSYVHNKLTPHTFNKKVERLGFKVLSYHYYAVPRSGFAKKILPLSAGSSLFVSVFRKNPE